jgi:hypothetical protein
MCTLLLLVLRQGSGDRRALAVKIRRLLERITNPHDAGLVERLANDLEREREAVFEADRH